ncbi:DUF1330 domain-containing protein [Tsukamurella tyrosinosolvens]|uniref:DUF1330 domain-containing protein n=1 Tax=Tsukamurella tyrosinosolvens TaxID=57704 RepID=UPI000C7F1711|nr:hypothetical protein ASU32_07495 [Tsukamurella tyrosinosolvens]
MTAYLIVTVTATGSAERLAEYRDRVGATVARFGGRYLARSSEPDVLEEEWAADQVVLVEFPDLEAARAWNASAEYREIASLRTENAASVRLLGGGPGWLVAVRTRGPDGRAGRPARVGGAPPQRPQRAVRRRPEQ